MSYAKWRVFKGFQLCCSYEVAPEAEASDIDIPEKLGKVMTDEDDEQVLTTENKPQDSLELKSEDGDIKIIAEK